MTCAYAGRRGEETEEMKRKKKGPKKGDPHSQSVCEA